MASQISVGEENGIRIRVYGEKAGLEWHQEAPNTLWLKYNDRPKEMVRTGVGSLSQFTTANIRTPPGHPEGYLEAFANLYRNFAEQIQAKLAGTPPSEVAQDLPGITEAVRGMSFIENVVAASSSGEKWHTLPNY